MGQAKGIVAGGVFGGISGALSFALAPETGGASLGAYILVGVLLGALGGAIPVIADAIWGKRVELPIATAKIEDQQVNTYTRTGRIPIVYGQREIGANIIHLGKLEYKDVFISETGRNESHLFGQMLLGLAEGPCQAIVALYLEDTPQGDDHWRFIPGLQDDQRTPELDGFAPSGRNPRYPNTCKAFFDGDLGFVSSIPNFRVDLRGIYPTVRVEGDYAASWRPAQAWLDGPTNTVLIRPDTGFDDPIGLITYEVPLQSQEPDVTYTAPPSDMGGAIQRGWYFGRISLLLAQDPADPRGFWFGESGLDPDSVAWTRTDLGAAYSAEILMSCVDDRACRLHTLHRRSDGTYYIIAISVLTHDRVQHVIPDAGFAGAEFLAMQFKPEDNAYWFVVRGGSAGDGLLGTYVVTTREWRGVASLDATATIGVVKLGIFAFVFFPDAVTRVNTVTGEVVEGVPLTDFMSAEDGEALGPTIEAVSVSQSIHRYAGVVICQNLSGDWRIGVFHEQRGLGETYSVPTPYRRYVMGDATGGANYIAKPGWSETPPDDLSTLFWVTNGPADVDRSLEDMVGAGADYKTRDPDGTVETLMSGCRIFSWFPIRNNQQEPRRVIFAKQDPDTLEWDFWFTVKGGFINEDTPEGGGRDYVLPNYDIPDLSSLMQFDRVWPDGFGFGSYSVGADDFHVVIYDLLDPIMEPSDVDDFYVGEVIGGAIGGLTYSYRLITSYNGSTHTVGFDNAIYRNPDTNQPGWLFIGVTASRWSMETYTVVTPVECSVPKAWDNGPLQPSLDLGGRMIAHFHNGRNTVPEIADIIDILLDRLKDGEIDEDTDIKVYEHEGTYDLTAVKYSFDVYERFNFVPNAPLIQFGTIEVKGDELVPAIAARLNEAQTPDIYRDTWFDKEIKDVDFDGFPPLKYFNWHGRFHALRRDCYGTTAEGEDVVVASDAIVGSWESYRRKLVQEDKSPTITMTIRPDGFSHDWFEMRVTPASIVIDLATNTRYGRGMTVGATVGAEGDIAATSWMSLHGYSLEQIMVDGDVIRRFICNYVKAEDSTFDDACEEVLAAALATRVTLDGKLGVSFDCGDTQAVAEFDVSTIVAKTFGNATKSPKSSINRVRVLFQNEVDRREDQQPADDQDNQEVTGSVREQVVQAPTVTDPRRAAFIAHRILQSTLTDRQGIEFASGAWAYMVLDPGDIVAVTHPQGRYERRPFRVIDVEDAGEQTQLAMTGVSPFTLDANLIRVAKATDGDQGQQRGEGDGRTRDRSTEAFHGRALMPTRVLAVRREDGNLILMGHRAPASGITNAVVAKLVDPADEQPGDIRVVTPRSFALIDSVTDSAANPTLTGLIDTRQQISLPARAYLVKKVTADPEPELVEEVRVTAYTPPQDVTNPSTIGSVTIYRPFRVEGAEASVETVESDSVWVTTAATGDQDPAAEPVSYDGRGVHASAWSNAGEWSDITDAVRPSGARIGTAALVKRLDSILIGIAGTGLWMPNAIKVELAQAASGDQNLVWEYSCELDPTCPLGVWKPLTVLDGTRGFRQTGIVHIEIPPGWACSARWDQHGNFIGGDSGDKPRRFWIRVQRRQIRGTGVLVEAVTLQNLPIVLMEPPSPALREAPERSQGRPMTYRFIARSTQREEVSQLQPGSIAASPGARWRLLMIGYPLLVQTGQELENGDAIATDDGLDYTLEFQYTSASHGWGSAAFGETAFGLADDPHLKGAIVKVVRASDSTELRSTTLQRPDNLFTYTWEDRQADGNVPVVVEVRQYDDRGFFGPVFRLGIGLEAYS